MDCTAIAERHTAVDCRRVESTGNHAKIPDAGDHRLCRKKMIEAAAWRPANPYTTLHADFQQYSQACNVCAALYHLPFVGPPHHLLCQSLESAARRHLALAAGWYCNGTAMSEDLDIGSSCFAGVGHHVDTP